MELKWEWPADRTPARYAVAEVNRFKKQGGGLFGINRSASIAGNLPQAHLLEATVVGGTIGAPSFRMLVPLPEIGPLSKGDVIGLGLLDAPVCVCIQRIPDHIDPADRLSWAEDFACGGG